MTRNTPHPSDATAFLSSEFERPNVDGSYTSLRKTWMRYEGDQNLTSVTSGGFNQRPAYQRTDYEDGKFTDVTYSEFDGLGHFRKAVTDGDFESGNVRTTFSNYNPNAGTYELDANGNLIPGFTLPSQSGPWLLTTFDRQWTAEGSQTSAAAFCFDSKGFLTSQRTFKNFGETPGATAQDLLSIFTRHTTNGNLLEEQYFGGDEGSTAPTTYTCGSAITGETYRIDHGYQYGTRNNSRSMHANGTPMTFDLLDRDIDFNAGLALKSRRYSTVGLNDGVLTTYTYDRLGRLKKVTGPKARTEYSYQFQPPKITVSDYNGTTEALIRQATAEFDVLGRTTRETRSMPESVTAARETKYNSLGWKTEGSDWGTSAFTVFTYDTFGRPTMIRPPDQTEATALQIAYTGISSVVRTSKVRTNGDAAPLIAGNYSDAVTTEDHDRQGRLVRVTEPAQTIGGARPVTEYSYDVGGRLTTVCANKVTVCGQSRTFSYDNRGFLLTETHAENGTTTYASYDARGHLRRRFLGSATTPFHHLGFVYDPAGRLTQVHEADSNGNETRKLKYFTYGLDNSGADLRNGRLVSAMRFNWVRANGVDFNVRLVEELKYEDPDGSVSSRNTKNFICQVSGGETCRSISAGTLDDQFQQTFTYDVLGAAATLGYPECLHSGCVNLIGNRTITNGYSNGILTSVTWSGAVVPNTFTYHPSGLLNEVRHDNGVIDEQTIDPNVPSRPLSLITKNALDGGTCVIPSFTIQPQSQTITSGSSLQLEADAVGETGHAISYQWYRGTAPDTTNPVGMSSRFLNVTPTVTTSYWVKATNDCPNGTTASVTATVTVCIVPSVTLPADRTITRTTSTTLTSTASGSAVLAYQWYTVVGTTPTQINGATSATLTVSPTQTTRYRVIVTNDCGSDSDDLIVNVVSPPTTPSSVNASYDPGTGRNIVTWTGSTSAVGIDHYLVERMPDALTFSTAATTFQGSTALLAGRTYLYYIRAVDTQNVSSAQSGPDLTTRVVFSDEPLVGGVSLIRGVHVSELRQAIDAVRAAAGLPAAWANYNPLTGSVLAATFTELRNRLNEARGNLLLPEINFSTLVVSGQPIRGATVTELRSGVK